MKFDFTAECFKVFDDNGSHNITFIVMISFSVFIFNLEGILPGDIK